MTDHLNLDIAVIGGGIQGAGVAQAAAAAGYSVALIEKTGWAAGTSGKSSKLIHGGLRYLAGGHLHLVRESLRERATLLRIAPQLVHSELFHIPLYRQSRLRSWQLAVGLALYAALAGGGRHCGFSRLPKCRWTTLAGLRTDELRSVWRYWDARTDDVALTRAVVSSAASLGARLWCPAAVIDAERTASGYRLRLQTTTGEQQLACRVLVNCAGPWINQMAGRIAPTPPGVAVDLVQGTHLVLTEPVVDHCYYLEAPADGRAVFLLPWRGGSLLGTTETLFTGDPDAVAPLPEEEAYLLAVLRHYFPAATPVVSARMAGLRVLPRASDRPFQRSREVQLITDDRRAPRYVAVYGGKLTGYRATAAKVLRLTAKTLGPRVVRARDTANLRLP